MQNDIVKPPAAQKSAASGAQPPSASQQAPASQPVNDVTVKANPNAPQSPQKPQAAGNPQATAEQANAPVKTDSKTAVQSPKSTSSNRPTAVIAAAVTVCLLLVGGVVYLGIRSNSSEPAAPAISQTPQTGATEPAAPVNTEVDALITDADALAAPSQDLATELSDQNLGL